MKKRQSGEGTSREIYSDVGMMWFHIQGVSRVRETTRDKKEKLNERGTVSRVYHVRELNLFSSKFSDFF